MKSDLIIVGGGIIGLYSAFVLAKRGVKITLLDKGNFGRESSWAAGGILTTLLPWNYDKRISQFTVNAIQSYKELSELLLERTAIDIELWKCGLLVKNEKIFEEAKLWCTQNNFQSVTDINSRDISLPDVYQLRPPLLLRALTEYLNQAGINLMSNTDVLSLQIDNSKVVGVNTSQGLIESEHVVWATGAWASKLSSSDNLLNLPSVTPVLGQMIAMSGKGINLNTILFHHGHYLIPRKDGMILAGSTLEHVGYNKKTTDNARQDLWKKSLRLMPELEKANITHHWAGLRPGSSDNLPTVGAHPTIKGLHMNVGHFRYGLLMAPHCAELISDTIFS